MITKTSQEFFKSLKESKLPLIGIDYGEKKTGVAISNPERTIAMPLKAIYADSANLKIAGILELISYYKIGGIVIGLPVNMNGSLGPQTEIIFRFTEKLSLQIDLPIFLQDERLTSKAANNLLKMLGMKRLERSQKDDAMAASLILETVLNSLNRFT